MRFLEEGGSFLFDNLLESVVPVLLIIDKSALFYLCPTTSIPIFPGRRFHISPEIDVNCSAIFTHTSSFFPDTKRSWHDDSNETMSPLAAWTKNIKLHGPDNRAPGWVLERVFILWHTNWAFVYFFTYKLSTCAPGLMGSGRRVLPRRGPDVHQHGMDRGGRPGLPGVRIRRHHPQVPQRPTCLTSDSPNKIACFGCIKLNPHILFLWIKVHPKFWTRSGKRLCMPVFSLLV